MISGFGEQALPDGLHHIGGLALAGQLFGHEVHVGCHMVVKMPISLAEIVESGIAVAVVDEPVLGTLSVTGELNIALAALARQRLVLEQTEALLLGTVEHLDERLLADVAQMVLGTHEMVAGVDVAVGLHHTRMTALSGIGADTRSLTHPVSKRAIENLHVGLPHIVLHPFVENGTEETAPFFPLNPP